MSGPPPFPERFESVVSPMVELGDVVRDSLADQRRILISGPLDQEAITFLAAQLMALDGVSSRDVEIIVSSPGGPIADIFPALDVFDLMRAKVNAIVIGAVGATAVGLVAACTGERRAAPHATFSLRLDAAESIPSTAGDVIGRAEQLVELRSRYLAALSALTGQHEDLLVNEIDSGRAHTAEEAKAMGIIDTVASRSR